MEVPAQRARCDFKIDAADSGRKGAFRKVSDGEKAFSEFIVGLFPEEFGNTPIDKKGFCGEMAWPVTATHRDR